VSGVGRRALLPRGMLTKPGTCCAARGWRATQRRSHRGAGEPSRAAPPLPPWSVTSHLWKRQSASTLPHCFNFEVVFDVVIIIRRRCNRVLRCYNCCSQMLHECSWSCCNYFLEMFQSLSAHVASAFVLRYMVSVFMFTVIFSCCNYCIPVSQQVLGMLESFAFMMQSFLIYVCKTLCTYCIRVLDMLRVPHANV
jgi:hypothetical protein